MNKKRMHQADYYEELLEETDMLREEHPGCGMAKLYDTLQPKNIGRDKYIEIIRELGYRIQYKRRYKNTTKGQNSKYDNKIEGMLVSKPNQLWQSDITYFYVNSRYYYITFILDVYTKEIVGYNVSENLRAESNIKALKMALRKINKKSIKGLIHHSDRGSQYNDKEYIGILRENGIEISMGNKAQDNAYAERVNGIIKNEYLKYRGIKSYKELVRETKRSVEHYNTKRSHKSLPKRYSPQNFSNYLTTIKEEAKPEVLIYSKYKKIIQFPYGQLDVVRNETLGNYLCPLVN